LAPTLSQKSRSLYLGRHWVVASNAAKGGGITMSDIRSETLAVKQELKTLDNPTFLWGAAAIGEVIGKPGRDVLHLLKNGRIKSARKIGGRYVASRSALLREFGAA
jgi:hypothetical protein